MRWLVLAICIFGLISCDNQKQGSNIDKPRPVRYATASIDLKLKKETYVKLLDRSIDLVKEDGDAVSVKTAFETIRSFILRENGDVDQVLNALDFLNRYFSDKGFVYISQKEFFDLSHFVQLLINYRYPVGLG